MNRHGFTLIELLVVLAILGAVTTLAMRSASRIQERTSFESTQRALDTTVAALIGDGDPDEPGFLGDMGRMPRGTKVGNGYLVPTELWSPLPEIADSAVRPSKDAEVFVLSGWRGPYLQLPVPDPTETNPDLKLARHLDGYGNEILLRREDGPDSTIWTVVSRGEKLDDASDDLHRILYLDAPDQVTINHLFSKVSGTVELDALPTQSDTIVTVVAYGPDETFGDVGNHPHEATATQLGSSTTFAFEFEKSLTRGPRVVRAYVHKIGTPPHAAPVATSRVHRITLAPSAHFLALEIDVPSPGAGGPVNPKDGVLGAGG